ncbi:hybrid sensor histidine kinase/response regulator [Phormidesmis sp. 146-33]
MTGKKILIVEDESVVALNIQVRLEAANYCVVGVADSDQTAMTLAIATQPDLVLMDIRLKSGQNGVSVAEKIRKQSDVPIVYLTAYTDTTILQEAQQTEPYGYILKPFDPANLYSTIEIALKKHQAHQQLQTLNHDLEQRIHQQTQALKQVRQQLKGKVADRQHAETATLEASAKERELNDLKSRFVTTVSHEFRTPLSIMMTSAELLERMGSACPEDRRVTYLQKIREAVRSMTRILSDMLTLGKVKSEKLEFNPTWIELRSFCQKIISDLQLSETSSPPIHVEILGDRTEGFWDEALLTLMLVNLLSNAVKYSPDRTPISLSICCPIASEPEFVMFRVQDHGIGIPPEDLPRLFESFHRAQNVDTIAGAGLGLAIVQQCVERHQGNIVVESQLGRGTIVEVKLPRGILRIAN